MTATPADGSQQPDWGYRLIVTLICGIAVWLLLLPVSDFIQRTTLNRFHQQTGSFAAWAVQAPIPAMYSFYNAVKYEPAPWDASPWDRPQQITANHFPTRAFTFGHDRMKLGTPQRGLITLRSQYRDQILETRWTVVRDDQGRLSISGEVLP